MADSVIKYSDLIGEDDTFDVIFDNIDQLKKELDKIDEQGNLLPDDQRLNRLGKANVSRDFCSQDNI